jgi:hypothetical protein
MKDKLCWEETEEEVEVEEEEEKNQTKTICLPSFEGETQLPVGAPEG